MIQQSLSNDYYGTLNSNMIRESLHTAHVQCNRALHAHADIDDSYSGTTSISLLVQPTRVTVSNVGDSRAILGTTVVQQEQQQEEEEKDEKKWKAVPLSKDQTPHRKDEAKRCQQHGARILSFGQLQGDTAYHDDNDDDDDDDEDPPRVWAPDGKYPGTAFTRSIGDRIAKQYGVCAEPEVLPVTLSTNEKCLVLASDAF